MERKLRFDEERRLRLYVLSLNSFLVARVGSFELVKVSKIGIESASFPIFDGKFFH